MLRGQLIKSFGKLAPGKRATRHASTLPKVAPQEEYDAAKVTTLDSGLRVASYRNHKKTATVGVWIDSGSRYETATTNGVASLYEQLIYTGTPNRSAQKLQQDLAQLGAQLKSVTTRDYTAYYAECKGDDVEKVVDILADVLGNTNISDSHLEEQRHILLRKIEEHAEDHRATVYDHLHLTAFQGNTMSFAPTGVAQCVENLTKKDVLDFAEDHYKPHRIVLTGAGAVDHDLLIKLGEKHFGHLNNEYKRKIPNLETMRNGVRFTGSDFQFRNDNVPLMYVAIAVEGVPRGHPDALPLMVASHYCGNYDKKQNATTIVPHTLQEELSKNHPSLHALESFSLNYANTGLWGMYYCCEGNHIMDVFGLTKAVQHKWRHLSVTCVDAEIDWAKYGLKTRLINDLTSNNTSLAHHVATEVISGIENVTTVSKLEEQIEAIDANTIQKTMKTQVYDRDPAMAGVGRTEAMVGWFDVRGGMSWWRL